MKLIMLVQVRAQVDSIIVKGRPVVLSRPNRVMIIDEEGEPAGVLNIQTASMMDQSWGGRLRSGTGIFQLGSMDSMVSIDFFEEGSGVLDGY